jgi:alpha-beta hydrolase superfamily lysophospholipase
LNVPELPALHVHRWLPASAPRAALLIVHGMSEHGARYARFATALNTDGWAVYAPDLPGHGLSIRDVRNRGHFADRDGWNKTLVAIHAVREQIAAELPGCPIVLFGHSMGSFLSQHYIVEHGAGLRGAILSATTGDLGATRSLGRALLRAEAAIFGIRHPSALAEALTFKTFNKAFDTRGAPARTPFDWLSRDPVEVDKYVADPLCGFRCTAGLWIDLLGAGASLCDPRRLARVPKDLPILLIAGGSDPVSAGARGPEILAHAYRAAGIDRVDMEIYPDGRHELLNDICREEVSAALRGWLDRLVR